MRERQLRDPLGSDADVAPLRRIETHVMDSRSPMWLHLEPDQRQVAQATFEVLT